MSDDSKLYASGGAALLNSCALEELRRNTELQGLVEAMREKEARFVQQLGCVDDAAIRLSCQRYIAGLLEGCELDEAYVAEEPSAFSRAAFSLKGNLSLARQRRYMREVARTYAHVCDGALFVPQCIDDYHRLWELAMVGEPRWSEDFPTSAFRTNFTVVRSGDEDEEVLQRNTPPERIEAELTELLGFLGDESISQEARACASYASVEFTHPFRDGNGHVGRMLLITLLADRYSLSTIVRFSHELTVGRKIGRLLIPLREGELSIAGFCLEVLGWLYDVQPTAVSDVVGSAS